MISALCEFPFLSAACYHIVNNIALLNNEHTIVVSRCLEVSFDCSRQLGTDALLKMTPI